MKEQATGDICASRHQGADTSVEANKKVQKTKDQELIYGYIYHAGRFGHTLDELSIMLHRNPNALSGRLTELVRAGKIVVSEERRLTRTGSHARVYKAAPNPDVNPWNEKQDKQTTQEVE